MDAEKTRMIDMLNLEVFVGVFESEQDVAEYVSLQCGECFSVS